MGILNNLRDKGIKREEFERIKTMIDGQNLLGIQTNEDYAQFYSIPVLHSIGLDFPHKNNEAIRNAKYEDFQAFLKKFFGQKWNVIQAGPGKTAAVEKKKTPAGKKTAKKKKKA